MRGSTGIDDVLARLWFSRLWIAQEVILAKDISLHLGMESLTWSQFRRAVKMLWTADCQFISFSHESDLTRPIAHALTLIDARDKWKSMKGGNMLMRDYTQQIFGKTRELSKWGCQDERDRVFAILGFIPKDSDLRLAPDYTVDSREVYIRFAREHILHEGLLILLFAGLEQRGGTGLLEFIKESGDSEGRLDDPDLDKLGLPSWIPDLRPDRRSVPHRYWYPVSFEAAMNRVPAVVLHNSCHHVLAVRGCVFDTIFQPLPSKITRPGKDGVMDFLETMIYLGFIFRYSKDHYEVKGGYPTGEDFETVFNSVITAGKTTGKLMRLAEDRNPDWIDRNLELLKRGSETNFQATIEMVVESPSEIQDIALFFSSLSFLFLHDQCILTEEGYMGMAPNCSKLDKIAWINELQSLVILRPVIEGQQYQLVGPCFLHGLMHGELAAKGNDEDTCTFIELI